MESMGTLETREPVGIRSVCFRQCKRRQPQKPRKWTGFYASKNLSQKLPIAQQLVVRGTENNLFSPWQHPPGAAENRFQAEGFPGPLRQLFCPGLCFDCLLLGRQKERCGKSKRGGQVNALFSPPSSCNGSLGLLGCFLLKPESQASCYEYPSCGVMQCLSCV